MLHLGWELQKDGKTIKKTFNTTQKGTEKITVEDLAGNEASQSIEVNIDKNGPTFSQPVCKLTAGGAMVSIVASETIDGKRLPKGWELDPTDHRTLTKLYTYEDDNDKDGKIKETPTFYDTVGTGNSGSVDIVVDGLKPAVLSMTITPETGNVNKKTVKITSDQPLKALIKIGKDEVTKDWTILSDKEITRDYTSDTTEEIIVYRAEGGVPTKKKIEVKGIDSVAPYLKNGKPKYEVDEDDHTYVYVTLEFNEEINDIGDGWTHYENTNTYGKIYYENKSEKITVTDKAGNSSEIEVNVTQIEEKDFAVKECRYSPNKGPTKEDVTVTIIVNKHIDENTLPYGWELSEDFKSIKHTYTDTGHIEEMIKINSLTGETAEQQVVVDIDKEEVEGGFQVRYDHEDNTSLTVTIIPNKEIEPIYGWQRKENGTYVKKYYKNIGLQEIEIRDKVGHTDTVRFDVKDITEEDFKVKKIDYSTKDLTSENVIVTITVNKDIDENALPTGWKMIKPNPDAKTITYEYEEPKTETIRIKSLSGEWTYGEVKIDNIDKSPLEVEVDQTPEQPTKGPIRKIIKANRKINDIRRLGTK